MMRIYRIRIPLAPTSLAVALFVLAASVAVGVLAQEEETVWATPLNLSQSGAATQPVVVSDVEDEFHVIWQDAYAGFIYTHGDGDSWSQPLEVRFPFSEPAFARPGDIDDRSTTQIDESFTAFYDPLLVADDGQLHAFWTDLSGSLFYSQVSLSTIISPTSWTSPAELAGTIATYNVVAGENDRLHLAYIQSDSTEEAPSGAYYLRSEDGGETWLEDPILLYQSGYLRGIAANQSNIQVVDDESGGVHVVWDDRLRDAVYAVRSLNGGTTWNPPERIDSHAEEDDAAAAGPSRINMIVAEDQIHLTWQAQHEESDCAQYHQSSDDAGRTWQPKIVAFESALGCPFGSRFIEGESGLIFLLLDTQQGVLLQAWDGQRWSKPELQQPMSSFTNPETFRQVALACRRVDLNQANQLFVFGCGTGNGQDIWMIERPMGDLADWSALSAPTPVWSLPATVFESQLTLLSPSLVVDPDGLLHAFWIETDETARTAPDATIYHVSWNGASWSRVVPLLNLPAQRADRLSAIMDREERFLLTWRNPDLNAYFMSQVERAQVLIPPQWSSPYELLSPEMLATHPFMFVGETGALLVVYAVPLNEGRGIYWIRSDEGANVWSEPTLIFDAAAVEWEAVSAPYLEQTENGHLHLLWARRSALQDEATSEALFYARSEDDGRSWSEPQLIVEGEISWYRQYSLGHSTLLIAWQQEESAQSRLMSRWSLNSGITWDQPLQISLGLTDEASGKPSLGADSANRLHIVQVTGSGSSNLGLQTWSWQGSNWLIGERVDANVELSGIPYTDMAVATASDAQLVIMYAGAIPQQGSSQTVSNLFYTTRSLNIPSETPTPVPTQELPAATVTPAVTPVPASSPSPQVELPVDRDVTDNTSPLGFLANSSSSTKVAISIIPAGLIVVAIVTLYLSVSRRRR